MSGEAACLRCLFIARDQAAKTLAELDRGISEAAIAYCDTKGRGARPRLEALRKEVGA